MAPNSTSTSTIYDFNVVALHEHTDTCDIAFAFNNVKSEILDCFHCYHLAEYALILSIEKPDIVICNELELTHCNYIAKDLLLGISGF